MQAVTRTTLQQQRLQTLKKIEIAYNERIESLLNQKSKVLSQINRSFDARLMEINEMIRDSIHLKRKGKENNSVIHSIDRNIHQQISKNQKIKKSNKKYQCKY